MPEERPSSISQHLANERTFLAWLRTAFSLISLGFATNRFSLFIEDLHRKSHAAESASWERFQWFGSGMVMLGTAFVAFAMLHFRRIRRAIDAGRSVAGSGLLWGAAAGSLVFGLVSVALMFWR